MAYIFDPLRNTFIDDEDTSLGNKLALVDNEEIDKVIKQIDDKFGPGTVFPASDLPENKPAEVETTEQFNRFNRMYEDGGRVNLQAGTEVAFPKYPDLRQFSPYPSPEKDKLIAKFQKDLKKYLLNEIKNFNKTALPKEKYQVIEAQIHRAMGYNPTAGNKPPKSVVKYVKQVINTLPKDGTWELNTTGKGQLSDASDRKNPIPEDIKNNIRPFFRKNYKTKTLSQMAEELSGKQRGNPLFSSVQENIKRYKDFLIDKKIIKAKDLPKGMAGSEFGIKAPPEAYAGYRQKTKDLAILLGVDRDPKYFYTRGPNKGKFSYAQFDNELLKFLNYNLIKGSLSPDFPVEMLPSLEHTMGVGPGTIVGQGEALRKVELQTKQYNFDAKKGVSARSKIFRDVQAYLKTAQRMYQAGAFEEANESLRTVNKLYDLISERFSLKRKDLPKYTVDKKGIKEVNVKQVLKPETVQKSFFNFFKKVANQASDKTLKQIEKVQPSVAKVINLFKKGKDTLAKDYIKIRMPDVKGGELFSFAGYGPMPTIELGDKVMNVAKAVKPAAKALGTATLAVDPIFAALDFSKASSEGVSGGQAASYTGQSFFQDLMNLPRALEDLAYTATEKGTFENFGQKENRIFDYKPKTFADDYLKRVVEQTPKEVLEARKAIIDFDTEVLPGMTMVDDMEVPASKTEIDEARNLFMNERGVDLSVLDNLEEDKPELSPIIKSLVAPDQTLQDFMANGGRVGFSNGGAAGADDDFAAQLEYFFLNPDAELPAAQTFKETMNPISIVNDMIDPRNIPYYANRLVESGIRIGEFGARVLPAVGKLASDLIRKPAFKIKPAEGQGYVQDYTDIPPSNITGTGIFSEFLNNLVGSEGTKAITEKTGLAKLIKDEEQKMKDERKTAGAKILADQVTLGMELTAPIFPGFKLLKAYAKNRNLPVDKTTREIMDKEIDEVLTKQGISRRDFMKVAGAGGAVAIAKLLGIGDDLATVTKVAEKAVPKGPIVPPYFFTLVDKIKKLGRDESKAFATMDREVVYVYKDYELYEDLSTGNIRITRKIGDETGYKEEEMVYTKGIGDESTQGTPPDEYDEFTVRADPDGKMKNIDNGLEELDDLIDEIGAENITIKDLEAMGYEIDRLPMAVQRKLGIQKPVSDIDRALKKSDDDLPDLPF
jgi:hypothetical protein